MKKRILLVEDEEHIRSVLSLNLDLEGYEVVAVNNGVTALEKVEQEHYDLIVLDVMLPNISGYEVCEQVKLHLPDIAIIMVSAKNTSKDRVKGLKIGADDYISKPFDLEELLLRVSKLLNRNTDANKAPEHFTFGDNHIDFKNYLANRNGQEISLSKKETLLLKLFADNPETVISRQHILQTVWGYDVFPSTRTIDNFILGFRKNFEQDPKNPHHFISIRGVGYKFVP